MKTRPRRITPPGPRFHSSQRSPGLNKRTGLFMPRVLPLPMVADQLGGVGTTHLHIGHGGECLARQVTRSHSQGPDSLRSGDWPTVREAHEPAHRLVLAQRTRSSDPYENWTRRLRRLGQNNGIQRHDRNGCAGRLRRGSPPWVRAGARRAHRHAFGDVLAEEDDVRRDELL